MTDKEVIIETLNKHLDEFYKLKDQYESEYKKKIVRPISQSATAKSFKEKRKLLRDAPKARCVNCKRPVGSEFSIKYFKEENSLESGRIFTAKCGDSEDPCPLNINIKVQSTVPYQSELTSMETEINKLKKDIIIEKNNLVFGYTNKENYGDYFYELTAELEGKVELYNLYLTNYVKNVENPERQQELKKLIITYGANIEQIKAMIKEFDETNESKIIDNIVSMYINEMLPLSDKIMNYKYHVNMVEVHDNMAHLIQKRNTIADNEINNNIYKKPDEIILQFVTGVVQKKKPKATAPVPTVPSGPSVPLGPSGRKTLKATEPLLDKSLKKNITRKATTLLLEEDEGESSPLIKVSSSSPAPLPTTQVEKATLVGTPLAPTVQAVKKPTMILLEEEDSSPPIVVSPPSAIANATATNASGLLFTDPALNAAYEALPFDEQMRILDMPNEQDRINALTK